MTRKTQIGLLTAACVVCCVGVFIGARMSGSHRPTEMAKAPVTEEAPANPVPAEDVARAPETEKPSVQHMVGTNIEPAFSSPPDVSAPPPMDEVKVQGDSDRLPALAVEPAPVKQAIDLPPSLLPPVLKEELKNQAPPVEDPPGVLPINRELSAPKELTGKAPLPVASRPRYEPSEIALPQGFSTKTTPLTVPVPPPVATGDAKPVEMLEPPPTLQKERLVPVSPVTPAKKLVAGKANVLPLTGTHACTLQGACYGMTLPKAVRDQLGEQDVLFVTLGSDHSLWLTTAAGLEKLTDRMENSPADEGQVARRRYFAQTERVAVDKTGSMLLPAALVESAGLTQDAVLIGVGDHLELWDAQRWQKYSQTQHTEKE